VTLAAVPTKSYHSLTVWPEAVEVKGDQRINSFGVSGEVEVRTGTLVQKYPIADPEVHVGLGSYRRAQVLRIDWPNGGHQVEFETDDGQPLIAMQRLKGSCPFLFCDDGSSVKFVADFLWSTPLGMYINGQDKGGFLQTTDWIKIRGDQLRARNGRYDLRVQANLWETHFIDHLQLKAVDHPADVEVFVDERFFLEPTPPKVYVVGPPHPVAHAVDQTGADVTDVLRATDGRYLDVPRGHYQGVAEDHWVEVDLGPDAPSTGPLYLLAHGFVHPTDSSINVAVEQGTRDRPHGLSLEIPDGRGGWKVGRPLLGFPAGKNKTVVIRLDGVDGPAVSRRFRLRTNMEIYWDSLAYAVGRDDSLARLRDLTPNSADLRYKGILAISRASDSAPELPDYDKIVTRRQPWRDLIGYHTRYGDVRELLEKPDDRYVIMNAGDEIALNYQAPEDPPPGWTRDFVWVADGWVKDGDLNTRFSKTVLPLPWHGMTSYDRPPTSLRDDPVYQRFPADWRTYHTRWVTPDVFARGLRP
jgi:hypothetical protein